MSEISPNKIALHHNTAMTNGSANTVYQGVYRGQPAAIQTSGNSLFASAAEEMSFMRAERKTDSLAKRKISERLRPDTTRSEKTLNYLAKSNEIDKEKDLDPLLSAIYGKSKITGMQVRQIASSAFKDPVLQYIALTYIYEELKARRKKRSGATSSSDLDQSIEAVDSALQSLANEHGSSIRASVNIAEPLHSFIQKENGGQLGSFGALRRFYCDAVLDYGDLSDTFKRIIDQHGEENFSKSVRYLMLTLGADLASEGPSLPKERLGMIINDLYKLQSLECLDEETREFLQQLERMFGAKTVPKKVQLVEAVLSLLSQQWLYIEKVQRIPGSLNLTEDMKICFWQGFKELVRLLPLKSYNDPFEREKVLTTIQACLDLEIEKEAF